MWAINTINSKYSLETSLNFVVPAGYTLHTNPLPLLGGQRTVSLNIPYLGIVYFQDIGKKNLGTSSQTWGVFISYNELHWEFRYEGSGQLDITIHEDGSITFTSPTGGHISPVKVDE